MKFTMPSMVDFIYKTIPSRILAALIDGLIFWGLGYVLSLLLQKLPHAERIDQVIEMFGWYAYSVTMHVRFGGNIGKLLLRIRVYQLGSLNFLTIQQALIRDAPWMLLGMAGLIPAISTSSTSHAQGSASVTSLDSAISLGLLSSAWLVLELITALISSRRRAIHDFMAGSVVQRLQA